MHANNMHNPLLPAAHRVYPPTIHTISWPAARGVPNPNPPLKVAALLDLDTSVRFGRLRLILRLNDAVWGGCPPHSPDPPPCLVSAENQPVFGEGGGGRGGTPPTRRSIILDSFLS
jgi:hypothetical protein